MTGKSQVFSGSAAHRVSGFHLLARLHDTINHALLHAWCASPLGWMRGTIRTKAKAPVLENTLGSAVAAPTESGVLSRPYFLDASTFGRAYGFGRDGFVRKAGRTAEPVFSTSRPPAALENAACGFESRSGAKTMTTSPVASRSAAPTTTPHLDPIALHADACNALSMALHYLRQPDALNVPGAARKAAQALAALRRLAAFERLEAQA